MLACLLACLVSLWSSLPAGSHACARVLALRELWPWGSLLWTYLVDLPPGKVSIQRFTRVRHIAFFCSVSLHAAPQYLHIKPTTCLLLIVLLLGSVQLCHADASSNQTCLMEDWFLRSTTSPNQLRPSVGDQPASRSAGLRVNKHPQRSMYASPTAPSPWTQGMATQHSKPLCYLVAPGTEECFPCYNLPHLCLFRIE